MGNTFIQIIDALENEDSDFIKEISPQEKAFLEYYLSKKFSTIEDVIHSYKNQKLDLGKLILEILSLKETDRLLWLSLRIEKLSNMQIFHLKACLID